MQYPGVTFDGVPVPNGGKNDVPRTSHPRALDGTQNHAGPRDMQYESLSNIDLVPFLDPPVGPKDFHQKDTTSESSCFDRKSDPSFGWSHIEVTPVTQVVGMTFHTIHRRNSQDLRRIGRFRYHMASSIAEIFAVWMVKRYLLLLGGTAPGERDRTTLGTHTHTQSTRGGGADTGGSCVGSFCEGR